MDLPARFGKYELLEHLASGGMAEVFLARSFGAEGFEKRLVIKRILPSLASSPRFVSMFVKEAKISAGLSHPNVVQIFELGRVAPMTGDAPGGADLYIAMEHIWGRDLTRVNRTLRADGRAMPIPLAVYITACVLRGLAYAHARTTADGRSLQLVHRDVSPHNILIGFHGEVKLFDFGIARLVVDRENAASAALDEGAEESLEGEARPRGGKYAYMSPEQAAGRRLDGRSDIFAAGICLYEMLVGHRLFGDPNPADKLRRIRAADVSDPRNENPAIPDALWAVLSKMLARDPADRHADAGLAEEDLWDFLYGAGLRADAVSVAALMADLFPGASDANPGATDLLGLVDDIARLGADPTANSSAGGAGASDASAKERGSDLTDDRSEPAGSGSSGAFGGTGSDSSAGSGLLREASGERKPVVVMVAEVCGFTDLSASLDSQHVARQHYQLLRQVRRVVDRYGGVIDRYQDDSFVVFFGVPRTHEQDADRALSCATHLLQMGRRRGRDSIPLDLSVGIHRGEITMGRRSGRTFKYLARGDTMKLAWRLSMEADVGEILVSDTVAGLVGERFLFTQGPPVRPKGADAPRPSFALAGRRRRLATAGGSWVRRGDELERLGSALAGLSDPVNGDRPSGRAQGGGIINLFGPLGSGKTRLVRELAGLARSRGVPMFVGRALPYGEERPLGPIRDIVAAVAGFDPYGPSDAVRDQLARLSQIGLSDDDVATLTRLFAVQPDREVDADRQAVYRATAALFRGLAQDRPVLVAVEDAQYLKPVERDLLAHVVRSTADLPVLYLSTSRAALPPPLGESENAIVLGRLPPDAQRRLIAEIVGAREVDDDLIERIASSAKGNALYTEEMAKALLKGGRVEVSDGRARLADPSTDLGLPPSLEGLVAARVDALESRAKALLQIASVIGMAFSPALLSTSAGLADADSLMGELIASGLVECEGADGEGRCVFASPLIWEAIRRSVIDQQRRELHALVAAGMERLYADRLDAHQMALATHHAGAGHLLLAGHHALRAGDLLRQQQLLAPATECWERAVRWVEAVDDQGFDGARELEAELRLKVGGARFLLGDKRKAEVELQLALDLAAELEDDELEARAQLALGQFYRAAGRMVLAHSHLEQGEQAAMLALPGASWGRAVAVEALEGLGQLAHEGGLNTEARRYYERALEVAAGDGALVARALLGLANQGIRAGEEQRALELLDEALRLAEAGGDRILVGRVRNNLGIVHHGAGRYPEALTEFRHALEVRQGIGYRPGVVVNLHNIGDTQMRLGEPGRAWSAFQQSRELANEIGWELGVVMNDAWLGYLDGCRILGESDRPEASLRAVEERLDSIAERAARLGDPEIGVTARWLHGRLLADCGRKDASRAALELALAEARRVEARTLERDVLEALRALPDPA